MDDMKRKEAIDKLRAVTKEDVERLLYSVPGGNLVKMKKGVYTVSVKDVHFDENTQQLRINFKTRRIKRKLMKDGWNNE